MKVHSPLVHHYRTRQNQKVTISRHFPSNDDSSHVIAHCYRKTLENQATQRPFTIHPSRYLYVKRTLSALTGAKRAKTRKYTSTLTGSTHSLCVYTVHSTRRAYFDKNVLRVFQNLARIFIRQMNYDFASMQKRARGEFKMKTTYGRDQAVTRLKIVDYNISKICKIFPSV